MAGSIELLARPGSDEDHRAKSKFRSAGFALGVFGVILVMVTLIANVVAGGLVVEPGEELATAEILGWSFGLTTTAFAVIKVAIAVVLMGIVVRLWMRVDAVKVAVARLMPTSTQGRSRPRGEIDTDFGPATETAEPPELLPIHRMARAMWAPMLAMGVMAVLVGLALSFIQSAQVGSNPELAVTLSAWTQGAQFLGEGMLLAGISLLLGTILAGLREGGAEVQQSVGANITTLKMPKTAKAFVAFMVVGLMIMVAQFALYIVAATSSSAVTIASWFTWLGPLREFGLGMLLLGIVLALVTIGDVLGFQFNRIREIIRTGQ